MPAAQTTLRTKFFDYLFNEERGYICIATQKPFKRETFKQSFFEWPKQKDELAAYVAHVAISNNVWFCVNLLSRQERKKEYCLPTNLVWADLDTCDPATVEPTPQCVIESSPNRWQAIWRIDSIVDPYTAEEFSKKIAYKYNANGIDPSGWDLTQLLRVPFSTNFKYATTPAVELKQALETPLPVGVFEILDVAIPHSEGKVDADMPKLEDLPDAEKAIYKYMPALNRTHFKEMYAVEPDEDWSKVLWRLLNICLEAGMTKEETFAVAISAKCNKYARDNRPITYLWREVVKASSIQEQVNAINEKFEPLLMPELVSEEEIAETEDTIIEEYIKWATEATDAVKVYHELSAFVLLSTLVAANLKLHTSYGTMIPNIWGLILGDSTLTRKTTAMRMAMDFITDIDRELLLATDGSAEGLLTGLSSRPNQVSMFFKDEVSGFMESISKKDYLAGMPETMTQLYDVPEFYSRRLRKETITITNPVFIFFGGGIRDRVYNLVTEEYILSGFLPRFLVVAGDAELNKIRRTGPASHSGNAERNRLLQEFSNLYELYSKEQTMTVGGQEIVTSSIAEVKLTEEAWEKYGSLEEKMVLTAYDSQLSMLALPTFERLSRSLLKMAMLISAARQVPNDDGIIWVTDKDVIKAASYIQDWGRYTVDLLINSGRGATQRLIDKMVRAIEKQPGILRSDIMRTHHMTRRLMDEVQGTLEDRLQIRVTKEGRGVRYWPT